MKCRRDVLQTDAVQNFLRNTCRNFKGFVSVRPNTLSEGN